MIIIIIIIIIIITFSKPNILCKYFPSTIHVCHSLCILSGDDLHNL